MEILKIIEKVKIFEYMINIFLMAPIIILTHLVYVSHYGNYNVTNISIESIVNSLYHFNTWFTIIVFCSILVISMFIESILLPFITIKSSKSKETQFDIETKAFFNYLITYFFGSNSDDAINEIKSDKRHFLSTCYKLPMALLLYSFCLFPYKWIMIIMLIISIYLFASIYKSLIAYIK